MKSSIKKLLAAPFLLGFSVIGNNLQAASCSGNGSFSTSDVTFENFAVDPTVQIDSTACHVGVPSGANPTDELNFVNTQWSALYGGGNFEFAAKDDIGSTADDVTNSVLGITWSLVFDAATDADGNTTPESGTWTLGWSDPSPADLPDYFDFVVLFKAASPPGQDGDVAAYLFDELLIPADPTTGEGSYVVNLTNPGGNFAELSHGTLFVRGGSTPPPPPPPPPSGNVPEPGILAMLGLSAIGFGMMGSRKKTIN